MLGVYLKENVGIEKPKACIYFSVWVPLTCINLKLPFFQDRHSLNRFLAVFQLKFELPYPRHYNMHITFSKMTLGRIQYQFLALCILFKKSSQKVDFLPKVRTQFKLLIGA